MSFIHRDAQTVKAQISHFLTSHPEIAEDAEFLADVLEGETDLHKVAEKALSERQEAVSMAHAIKSREDDLAERRKRYERRAEAMKDLIKDLMLSAGIDKLPLPEATLTITKPRMHVEVLDVDLIPQGYHRIKKEADKKAILDAYEAGAIIPGTLVQKSDFGIQVRTK